MRKINQDYDRKKIRRFFAILPVKTKKECRWLEIVTVQQEWRWIDYGEGEWVNKKFIDKQ